MQQKNWIMGLWKFKDTISVDTLGEIAGKWAAEDPNYLQLYIRKVAKDQVGIGFTYQLKADIDSEETHKAYEEYFEKISDFLKRKFGNGLAGWDLASSVQIIK